MIVKKENGEEEGDEFTLALLTATIDFIPDSGKAFKTLDIQSMATIASILK